jgi:predicted nucleic acid-binding protein
VALITELSGILQRRKFAQRLVDQRLSPALLVERYQTLVSTVEPVVLARVVAADPDDDQVLACALAAYADLIVSGDKRLRNLKTYHGIPIITAAEALVRIESTAS